ncbi:toll/interleukin-1 receptor domain-containing protein [Sorangium sp. So ce1389]|uniref:toll/interleukin-1 receptor domain-containing protein n=1 Tax=Sorangium sp. So ce1389 TaxID=3133336 RepID=UPI003F608CC7
MATIFFSYSHKYEEQRDRLETHLSMLKRQGLIDAWHDRRISAGDEVHREISKNLEAADVILLLISPDFLASEYCYNIEMARALERHDADEAVVIPVILRPCDWHSAPFGGIMATPKDGKPITRWTDIDEAFLDVTLSIKEALQKRGTSGPAVRFRPVPFASTVRPFVEVRSSNLRVAKQFTDHDRDQFLSEAFDYLTKFFSNSIEELSRRNPGIGGNVRLIDANRFTAVAYRNGSAICRCTIFIGGLGVSRATQRICYLNNDSGATNSFNESVSVNSDEHALYLQSFGMHARGTGELDKLTMQGAAELYWGMFIDPLQRA